MLSWRGLGLAWLKRSLSCLVGKVLVLRIGRRGLGFAFWLVWVTEWVFFFVVVKYGFLFRWDFGGQWAVVEARWW